MKVLVIDDEAGIRVGLQLALEGIHEVILAASASEGIQAIQKSKPDCILLDMFMGEEKGDQVLRYLKENQLKIPVVIISAFSTEVLHKEFGAESKDWIHYRKPIDIKDLRRLLHGIEEKR